MTQSQQLAPPVTTQPRCGCEPRHSYEDINTFDRKHPSHDPENQERSLVACLGTD